MTIDAHAAQDARLYATLSPEIDAARRAAAEQQGEQVKARDRFVANRAERRAREREDRRAAKLRIIQQITRGTR